MKLNLLMDPYGRLIGASGVDAEIAAGKKKAASADDAPSLGLEAAEGQNVLEVDVPDDFVDEAGGDLLGKLETLDAVKELRRAIPMSGEVSGAGGQGFSAPTGTLAQSLAGRHGGSQPSVGQL